MLTDVIDGPCAKFPEELFRAQCPQVVNDERPQVEDVVARESVPLLDDHHFGAEQLGLDRRAKSARSAADDQHLGEGKTNTFYFEKSKRLSSFLIFFLSMSISTSVDHLRADLEVSKREPVF